MYMCCTRVYDTLPATNVYLIGFVSTHSREASIQAPNLQSSHILDLRIILHESLSTSFTLKMYVRVSRVGPSTQSLAQDPL